MNILYICEEYPPGKSGGIGTMVHVLGRELARQEHNVYVVGLYPHGYGQADYEEDRGVKIWRLRYKTDFPFIKGNYSVTDRLILGFLKYSGLLSFDTVISTVRLFRCINRLVEKYKIDVIEIPDWNTFLHNSITVIKVPPFPAPLIVKLNGSKSYLSKELNTAINKRIFRAELALLERADAIASASFYTARKTKEAFNISKDITVLHNSVNIYPQPINKNRDNNIIFTGALVKNKGIISLLEAWNSVIPECPGAKLHIYGKGPVEKLKKLLNNESAASVIFHNHVPREILLKELSTAAAAIFPSYSECFSFAPMEAMAAGCAVIYTSRSSGPELITHNVNGLMVDPDDITGIARSIIFLITDKDARTRIAEEGKKTVTEKFSITHSARQHIEYYTRVINSFTRKDKS